MPNTQKLFAKAEKLLQKQKFDSALQLFLKLLQIEPHNEAVLLNLADISLRLGRPKESLQYNRLLAELYVKRSDSSKAIVTCRRILKSQPEDAKTLHRLASLLQKTRKTSEAIHAYREASAFYRRDTQPAEALECLKQAADLDSENIEDHVEVATLASACGNTALASQALLRAAAIAQKSQMQDRWGELAQRAYQLDPQSEAARIAAAEAFLSRGRAREAITLLLPMSSKIKEQTTLRLLCRAYLGVSDYENAERVCMALDPSHPETARLREGVIRGHLCTGKTDKAVSVLKDLRKQVYLGDERKPVFLALVEQIYSADENNLAVLELLPPLYNEFNRDNDLRLSLARLFSLYIAAERYGKAAETLERILDLDPYGPSHADQILNLEGHIDATWYSNIASRISVPGSGHAFVHDSLSGPGDMTESEETTTLEDLIVEGEMYYRYRLTQKLEKTLCKIDRLFPGVQEENEALRDLYEAAGFRPTLLSRAPGENVSANQAANSKTSSPRQKSAEKLDSVSAVTALIHRQGTPETILKAASEHFGRLVSASRCWIALGAPDTALPLTSEWISSGVRPSDPGASLRLWSFLAHDAPDSKCWAVNDAAAEVQLATVEAELHLLGVRAFLSVPLVDKEKAVGFLIVEQCGEPRLWTSDEKLLATSVASQVVLAVNNAKLRRLVRSLAGTDAATGLLPRSAYLDCLLEEARRAEEQCRPLSVCLLEPAGAASLSTRSAGIELSSYIREVGRAVSAHVRQNDIAIRYGPCSIALCLPDTPVEHSRIVVEKLQSHLAQTTPPPGFTAGYSAVVGGLYLESGFDAVDAVTEIINRLENSMETLRDQPEPAILVSSLPD